MSEEGVAAALRAVFAAVDRIPATAVEAANAAIGWRDLDAELARLESDAGLEVSFLRGGQPRLLTFRSGPLIIELEVSADGAGARLLGQLDPPRAAAVTIESEAWSHRTHADDQGRFSAAGLGPDRMRVVVSGGEGERTATEWFRP
jgi:hypothetical protein